MIDKIASYIGLAQRAGGAVYGEDRIAENAKSVRVVLIDAAAPEKYRMRLKKRCGDIPCHEIEDLSRAVHRDNVRAVGITNEQLAKTIIGLLR